MPAKNTNPEVEFYHQINFMRTGEMSRIGAEELLNRMRDLCKSMQARYNKTYVSPAVKYTGNSQAFDLKCKAEAEKTIEQLNTEFSVAQQIFDLVYAGPQTVGEAL